MVVVVDVVVVDVVDDVVVGVLVEAATGEEVVAASTVVSVSGEPHEAMTRHKAGVARRKVAERTRMVTGLRLGRRGPAHPGQMNPL